MSLHFMKLDDQGGFEFQVKISNCWILMAQIDPLLQEAFLNLPLLNPKESKI